MMERVVGRSGRNKRPRSEPELDALIEEATVDTYNESEQMMGFHAMLDEHNCFQRLKEFRRVATRLRQN